MNDSEFDQLLRSAGGAPPVPGDFQRAVWRRIEAYTGVRFWPAAPARGGDLLDEMIFTGRRPLIPISPRTTAGSCSARPRGMIRRWTC